MLRVMLALIVVGVLTASTTDSTGWLAVGHPGLSVRFEHTLRTECRSNCEHYTVLLTFRGSPSPGRTERSDWNSLADASCIDVLLPGRNSFACRQPGALSGTTKTGQPYAISRYRVKREQLEDLTNPAAVLRIRSLTLRLPEETRMVLAAFLRAAPVAASGD